MKYDVTIRAIRNNPSTGIYFIATALTAAYLVFKAILFYRDGVKLSLVEALLLSFVMITAATIVAVRERRAARELRAEMESFEEMTDYDDTLMFPAGTYYATYADWMDYDQPEDEGEVVDEDPWGGE